MRSRGLFSRGHFLFLPPGLIHIFTLDSVVVVNDKNSYIEKPERQNHILELRS